MRYLVMKFGGQITYSRTVVEVEAAAMELLKTVEAKNREVGEWRPTFKKGKGDKVASGGKGSVTKVPQPLELRIEQGRYYMLYHMTCNNQNFCDPCGNETYHLTRDCNMPKEAGIIHIPNLSEDLLRLTKYGVTDGEMCVIANVCPDTVDEAFALILSLKAVELRPSFRQAKLIS
ncbi:hypothetical protein FEM48_Zijuj08G0004500 [Ziziphus jujuba var. spinosa]|uniref:Uncharacterized protein n=1 Tax=Ziziphus jujuba var. spinosa TaxID=714518 RepID=A0A978UVX7_ZIZJJ|nr:hypothetical protein FEM48_Zijuj08G0004500 [Ziziphus jujuba var. spinosa]